MTTIGKRITSISQKTMQQFINYSWPGNIRELENVIERALILATGTVLQIEDEFPFLRQLQTSNVANYVVNQYNSLEEIEREYILKFLKDVGWVIEGSTSAAVILKINPNTLRSRMQKLGIRKPSPEKA